MTQQLKFAFLTLLVGCAAWFAPAARADEWDKQTVLTFSGPVEIPGKVLPAGTYVFKLADSQSDRNVVEVFTEDQKHLLATILAIPDYREEPTDKTVVTFEERSSGSPEAVHSWFYPGETYGVEFVYPKLTQQYADRSEAPAPPVAPPAAPQQQTSIEQQPQTEPTAPVTVPEEAEGEAIIAQVTPAAPADNAPSTDNESATTSLPDTPPDTLPQTAGNLASIPLVGIALLSGGFTAIRFATRKS